MADVQPFRGLRYDRERVGSLDRVIAPPYDVISPAQQQALYDLSPYNVVRLEYGREQGAERYLAAGRLLHEWRAGGVLRREAEPAYYLYEQTFAHAGTTFRRRSLFGRCRLEPFDSGIVRPHEYTMSGPKEDRLQLMQATMTNVSPIFSLYEPGANDPIAALLFDEGTGDAVRGVDLAGEQHTLVPLHDPALLREIAVFLAARTLYIADGHHRYETALRFRDERRAAAAHWTGEEPENFMLMAVTSAANPGLLILPIHRIVRPKAVPGDLGDRLAATFTVEALPGDAASKATIDAALGRLAASGTGAFVAVGLMPGRLALLTLRERAAVEARMPAEHPAAWKALDVNVLQYGILDAALGIGLAEVTAGGMVEFTEDAEEAVAAVRSGHAPLAFLVNAVRPEQMFAVADTGDRIPQKSTYFYPKLGTGLVLNPLE
ncbi:MAG TPA: DUF1015 domain-containing protein [Dehalococcoidia bacterium]|nr:DUF1015 domain-containing protein [Dehalococcoidia bacterium]